MRVLRPPGPGVGMTFLLLVACTATKEGDTRLLPSIANAPVYGVANLDDDDENGDEDWEDEGADGDDDRATLDLSGLERIEIALSGDTEAVRVWQGDEVLLDEDTTSAEIDGDVLTVEFGALRAHATLSVGIAGEPDTITEIPLRGAPLILNNHFQVAERVMSLETNDGFVDGFADALGEAYFTGSLRNYGWDVWVQDELEFATLTAPGQRMDVVIDSIRTDSGDYLDAFPERELEAPGIAVRTWGDGRATSQDSFGNLEVSPPVTVDGVSYPYGRIYWGETRAWGLTEELGEMLEDQRVQDPFTVDISWLCVGHVDEFTSFVPDPSAPKGFRFLYADTNVGRSFLAGLDPTTSLTRYRQDHGFSTIGDLVEDQALWSYNEDLQADYLDPNLEIFKAELGLDDEDIIRIPAVFEESRECGGAALSLIPGTVNLVVADLGDPSAQGGTTHVFLADPFLRTDEDDLGSDPLIAEVEALLPDTLTLHWLDDWEWYHLAWGEVHCGSNVERTPVASWWTEAAHLLEAE